MRYGKGRGGKEDSDEVGSVSDMIGTIGLFYIALLLIALLVVKIEPVWIDDGPRNPRAVALNGLGS
ncbi:KIR protein [Rhodomicrobium vannielii ATCC 17100]|jgi:hypothetical protein|uniref:KIR protein n=1 Tax=Rhodomicrobium vannielii (strain ATCC 17100 / DSM 162 / LMG 4299 / NCIMB 10020 / ATH 3.1.1) TaxID=648757 RepID=E3I5P4_RHOVT|nr:hypothetical protein [Rhodomicrobium vannielii]ADP72855.1 KIR protein [Rhodomicrobium vannielii ATCC 17100]